MNRHPFSVGLSVACLTGSALLSLLPASTTPTAAAGAGPASSPVALSAPDRVPLRTDVGSQQVLVLPPSGKAPSWVDVQKVWHSLSVARRSTAKYRAESAALRAGYRRQPGLTAHMYATFSKPSSGSFSPARPSSLVYMEMGGVPQLAGVGYSVAASTSPQTLDGLLPASLAQWNQPLNVCSPGKTLTAAHAATIHTAAGCIQAGGHFRASLPWTTTAWIWQPHAGLFTSTGSSMPGMAMGGISTARTRMPMTTEPYQMEMLSTDGMPVSWSDIRKVYTLFTAAQKLNNKYVDLSVARRDGFITAPFLYVPGQGAHYVLPSALTLNGSPTVDVNHPSVLVYNDAGGALKLASLLYLMPESSTPAQLSKVFPASMAVWHRHVNTCLVGVKVVAIHTHEACSAAGGYFLPTTGWMVHAWLWDNTTGLFDMDKDG